MSTSDPIADMLTRMRNGIMVGHKQVDVPASKMKISIAEILKSEGFISGYDLKASGTPESTIEIQLNYWGRGESAITGLKRVRRPGLRVYRGTNLGPSVYGYRGSAVVSTNKGVMTGHNARRQSVGGEVLFYVW